MKRHYLFTYLIDPSNTKLFFNIYCYSYCINITIVSWMLPRALIRSDKTVFLQKNCYRNGLIMCIVTRETCRPNKRSSPYPEFNIILNNHRKDVNWQNAPQADQHFKLPNHSFNQHARFTLIEQLDNMKIDQDLTTLKLNVKTSGWKN